MKAVMMLFLLAAATLCASAQTFQVTPLLKQGQRFELRVSRETPHPSSAKPILTRTPIHVKVIEASATSTVLEWDYDDPSYENVPPDLKASIGGMQQAMQQVRLEPVLDADGRFQSLRNWAQVLKESQSILEAATKQFEGASQAQMKKLMEEALTPENVAIEIRNYFAFSGQRFELRKPVPRTDTTPAPMNLGQLQMNVSVELTAITDSEATIVSRSESDPGSERKIAEALAARFLPPQERAHMDLSRFALKVQETVTAVIDRTTGMVKRMDRQYSMQAGPQRMAFSELTEMVTPPQTPEPK